MPAIKKKKEQVKAAVAKIREFHTTGLTSWKRHPSGAGGVIEKEAAEIGVNPDTLRKARQFAHPTNGYTPNELETLCALIRKHQMGQDDGKSVFGRTHIIRIVSVPKTDRRKLQTEAIKHGWSLTKLESTIAERYGARRDGGRRPRKAQNTNDLLAQLDQMCESWRRWQLIIDPEKPLKQVRTASDKPPPALLNGLPHDIRRRVRAVGAEIGALHAAVAAELQKRDPAHSVRHWFRGDPEAGSDEKKQPGGTKR